MMERCHSELIERVRVMSGRDQFGDPNDVPVCGCEVKLLTVEPFVVQRHDHSVARQRKSMPRLSVARRESHGCTPSWCTIARGPMHFTLALTLVAFAVTAGAAPPPGRLPVEQFSTKHGLVNDHVRTITTDSRGDLWIGTEEGVSRFDGHRFVNYTTADGLPHPYVTAIVESRSGPMYIATLGGLARLDRGATRGTRLFRTLLLDGKPILVNDVAEDRHGTMWVACHRDLCRATGVGLVVDPAYRQAGGAQIERLVTDRATGELWAGTFGGIMHRSAAGSWTHVAVQPHRGSDIIHGLTLERGLLWISNSFGVFVCRPDILPSLRSVPLAEQVTATFVTGDAFREPRGGELAFVRLTSSISSISICHSGVWARDAMWIPTKAGIARIGTTVEQLDTGAGMPGESLNAMALDVAGNLWAGSEFGGLLRLARSDIRTFTRATGLRHERINSIFELRPGVVCATSAGTRYLHCFENGAVQWAEIIPPSFEFAGWGWNQVVARDRNGEWWIATGQGVVRWPAIRSLADFAHAKPLAVYGAHSGLGADDVFRVWADSRGDLWFSTFGTHVLTRRDHETGTFVIYGEKDGVPLAAPTAFAEDRQGRIWIGSFAGHLLRYDGTRFGRVREGGWAEDQITALLFDSRGTLWIARRQGVSRIDDPSAPRPIVQSIANVTITGAMSLTELRDGTIAIGSTHGIDLLDPNTGRVSHISTSDGLAQNAVVATHEDADGAVWIGTLSGLSYMKQVPASPSLPPPRPRFDALDAGAERVNIAELGAYEIGALRMRWPDRTMMISFSAPDFDPRHPLQFEYRLTSHGDEQWTSAGTRRNITYERLPFGDQRFEVRTIGYGGRRSPPATVTLDVIPPFWRTWWFAAIAILFAIAIATALHRIRVGHILALQQMRTRVAVDLHDDLGSSLSRISILSEVVKRRMAKTSEDDHLFDQIGDTARGLIIALGDSIWSIDPRRDDLGSLLSRIRHFATDVLEAKSMSMDVVVPPSISSLELTPEKRRDLFLILKEALNNVAKHSHASRVSVTAQVDGRKLRIRVQDDGIGIARGDRPRHDGGHGLPNMHARAARAGGSLVIDSSDGRGTCVEVLVPLP